MRSWRERWEAIWMAVAFAEANEGEYANAILEESRRSAADRVATGRRPERRPRLPMYRS